MRAEIGIALGVVFDTSRFIVWVAVTFNDKFSVVTVKVAKIIAELVLAPELRAAELPVAKKLPEKFFSARLLLAKLPRPLDQTRKVVATAILHFTSSPLGRGLG